MNAAELRRAISDRIRAHLAGIDESGVPLGPVADGEPNASRVFRVALLEDENDGTRTSGKSGGILRVIQRFDIELGHQGNPELGPALWDQALTDEGAVRNALLLYQTSDALSPVQGSIFYQGRATPVLSRGGMWRLAQLRFQVTYTQTLEAA